MTTTRHNDEARARFERGARLCDQLAPLHSDPGARGYSEGMAQRLREVRPEEQPPDDSWFEGVERAIRSHGHEPVA